MSIIKELSLKHKDNGIINSSNIKLGDTPKPFIQWVGGKRKLIQQYQELLPKNYGKYYEPFVGGGALMFHLLPKEACISDSNKELITSYNTIKNNVYELIDLLKLMQTKNSKEYYNEVRSLDRNAEAYGQLTDVEVSARFIYLNKTCFNGLCRVNKKGENNVPYGRDAEKRGNICDENNLINISNYLQNVDIVLGDYIHIKDKIKENDFVFFDPPYFPITKTASFTSYTKEGFFEKEQKELKELFDYLTTKKVFALAANSDCDFINYLYKNYTLNKIFVKRLVNSDPTKRGNVITEVLVSNF